MRAALLTDYRRAIVFLAVLGALVLPGSAAAYAPETFSQMSGTSGCISETGAGGCTDGLGLTNAAGIAMRPSGTSAYAAASGSDAVTIFGRNQSTRALVQQTGLTGCISETGSGGTCTDGTALDGAQGIAVSPDSNNVYVASTVSDSVSVFDAQTQIGTLTQKAGVAGCVSETGTGGACTDGFSLDGAGTVIVSPDGRNVYVATNSAGIAVFDRGSNGSLTQKAGTAGCISDGGIFGCTAGTALQGTGGMAFSPDGSQLYVTAFNSASVVTLNRNTSTGVLSQQSCVSETGTGGACSDGSNLLGAAGVVVSADGKQAYVTANSSDAVVSFTRNTSSGALTQVSGAAGCISDTGAGGCTDGVALDSPFSISISPDQNTVAVASINSGAFLLFSRAKLTPGAGELRQSMCISSSGTGGACTVGRSVNGAFGVTFSDTGAELYGAAIIDNAVDSFDVKTTNGSISPTSLSFSAAVGSSSSQNVTITNSGQVDLPIVSLSLSGADANQFSLSGTCSNYLVEPGTSCTFPVTFIPTSTGSKVANVTIDVGQAAVTGTVGLTGSAVAAESTSSSSGAGATSTATDGPIATVVSKRLVARRSTKSNRRTTRVRVKCTSPSGTSCIGSLWLYRNIKRHTAKGSLKNVRASLGRKSYRIAAGKTKTITVTLTRKKGRYTFKKSIKIGAKTTTKQSSGPSVVKRKSLTLRRR